MARQWVGMGHEVHVLTGPGDRGGEHAPDLQHLVDGVPIVVHRAPAPGIEAPARPSLSATAPLAAARRVSRLRQIVGQWKGFPDSQRSWIRPAVSAGLRHHHRAPFDVVWSTSPPESAHFVARRLAARGIPWVADFRDQWSDYLLARWDPLSRFVIDRITALVLRPAATLTANTDGVAASIRRATHRPVHCIRNGFSEMPPCGQPVRTRTLGYFGRIDPLMQRPERLWPALRELRRAGKAWRIVFYLTGGGGGGATIDVPPDLRDLVEVESALPHEEALQRMQSMTALLVIAWEVRQGDAPVAGKLYEYVGSGRPVLVCAPGHYEARRLIEGRGLGVGGWTDTEIGAALRALDGYTVEPEARAGLAQASVAAELAGILASVVVERDSGQRPRRA